MGKREEKRKRDENGGTKEKVWERKER